MRSDDRHLFVNLRVSLSLVQPTTAAEDHHAERDEQTAFETCRATEQRQRINIPRIHEAVRKIEINIDKSGEGDEERRVLVAAQNGFEGRWLQSSALLQVVNVLLGKLVVARQGTVFSRQVFTTRLERRFDVFRRGALEFADDLAAEIRRHLEIDRIQQVDGNVQAAVEWYVQRWTRQSAIGHALIRLAAYAGGYVAEQLGDNMISAFGDESAGCLLANIGSLGYRHHVILRQALDDLDQIALRQRR